MNRVQGSLCLTLAGLACLWQGGCAPVNPYLANPAAMTQLKQRAAEALKRGVGYEALPSVRAQAIESLQETAPELGLAWIRTGLTDEHPAVRFAACMAVGTLRDQCSQHSIAGLLDDPDRSVQASAIFALHRLGDTSHTAELAAMLKDSPDLMVRRNAALVLGRLQEPGAIPLLAGVVGCKDEALHTQALEALVLLGSEPAMQQMQFVANSGNGPQEVIALNALAATRRQRFRKTFEYKLSEGTYLETKLAAARALGELGSNAGLPVALKAIDFDKPDTTLENDPPDNQITRIRRHLTPCARYTAQANAVYKALCGLASFRNPLLVAGGSEKGDQIDSFLFQGLFVRSRLVGRKVRNNYAVEPGCGSVLRKPLSAVVK